MVTKKEAERILAEVEEHHHFVLSNGVRLKSLHDLSSALSDMEAGTYVHHVNNERNDFCNWVQDVHRDEVLKTRIAESNGPLELRSAVSQRINELQSAGILDEIEKKKPEKIKRKRLIKPEMKKAAPIPVPKPSQSISSKALSGFQSFFRDFAKDISILFNVSGEELWDDILDLLFIKRK